MIRSFSCKNFRNITANDLTFERINILIGPNNSGKTNFIKALTFFAEMEKKSSGGGLKSSFLNAVSSNGWDHMFNKNAVWGEEIRLSWKLNIDKNPVEYVFAFQVGNTVEDCNILLEELNSDIKSNDYEAPFNYFRCHDRNIGKGSISTSVKKGEKNSRRSFKLDCKETLIRQFKDILLNNAYLYGDALVKGDLQNLLYRIQKYCSQYTTYATSQINSELMRRPGTPKNIDTSLNADGSNFINVFNHYNAEDIMWKHTFEQKMRELIPELIFLDSVTAYDQLVFRMLVGNTQYDLSDVSEGTLKALILNMLINMPMDEEKSLLTIDEPENNLHPAWQKVIGMWIQQSDKYSQYFISTHSPDFLDVFTDGFKHNNVAVFAFDGGTIRKITYDSIANELGDWELGDLYRTGDIALGGWPW